MRWFGELIGVFISAALGAQSDGLDFSCGLPRLKVDAEATSEDAGVLWQIRFTQRLPAKSIARFALCSKKGFFVRSVKDFADDNGHYGFSTRISRGKCACYIPFAALRHNEPGEHVLLVQVFVLKGGEADPIGCAFFEQELPDRGRWRRAEYLHPILQLLMLVAIADGKLTPRSVQVVQSICREGLEINENHQRSLQAALKTAGAQMASTDQEAVHQVVAYCRFRFPEVNAKDTGNMLLTVARADGCPSWRKVERIRWVLTGLGMGPARWQSLCRSEGLDCGDHSTTLGVPIGASAQEVRTAYLNLVKLAHPDLFATQSPEVQAAAQERTIALRTAYEALCDYAG